MRMFLHPNGNFAGGAMSLMSSEALSFGRSEATFTRIVSDSSAWRVLSPS